MPTGLHLLLHYIAESPITLTLPNVKYDKCILFISLQVCRKFFVAACSYIKQKLPLNNELLKHAEVADVQLRVHGVSYTDLDYFLERFPCLLPKGILFM